MLPGLVIPLTVVLFLSIMFLLVPLLLGRLRGCLFQLFITFVD
jgi:hypothetical protein